MWGECTVRQSVSICFSKIKPWIDSRAVLLYTTVKGVRERKYDKERRTMNE